MRAQLSPINSRTKSICLPEWFALQLASLECVTCAVRLTSRGVASLGRCLASCPTLLQCGMLWKLFGSFRRRYLPRRSPTSLPRLQACSSSSSSSSSSSGYSPSRANLRYVGSCVEAPVVLFGLDGIMWCSCIISLLPFCLVGSRGGGGYLTAGV